MTGRHTSCLAAALLLAATAGCSGTGEETQNKPRVLTVSPVRLVVHANAPSPGMVRLLVLREWTRNLERTAGIRSGPRERQVASVGFSPGLEGDGWGALVGYAVGSVLWVVVELVKFAFGWMVPSPRQPETIEYQDTVQEPVLRATLESVFGGPALDLGIQPVDGYLLDESATRLLGGPGAEVVIRAGDLSVFTRLPDAR